MAGQNGDVARKVLYGPRLAGSLRTRPTIGFLTAWIADGYVTGAWAGIMDVARERDVNVVNLVGSRLRTPLRSEAPGHVIFDLVNPVAIDGLVVCSEMLYHFVDVQELMSFLGRFSPLPMTGIGLLSSIPSVTLDLQDGQRQMMDHLINVHHYRRPAFLRGPGGEETAEAVYRGYLQGLAGHGLTVDPALVTPPARSWGAQIGSEGISVLLDERKLVPGHDFDVIVGPGDYEVLGAVTALQERGFRVPLDVPVTGFNNLEVARSATPNLTTVDRRMAELGRQATALLLDLLDGKPVPPNVIVPPEVVVRRSCGCLPQTVIQAAVHAPALPAGDLLPITVLSTREMLATAIRRAGRPGAVGLVRNLDLLWADRLADAFLAAIEGGTSGAFLTALEGVLGQVVASDADVSVWHGVLSALRQAAHQTLSGDALGRSEDLLQQGRVLVGDFAERAQGQRKLEAEDQVRTLSDITQSLITTFDVDSLMGVLATDLPRLGIPAGYLSLYEDPATPTGWARLLLAYDGDGRLATGLAGRRFPAPQFVPGDLLPARRVDLIVLPLYFQEEQLGLLALQMGPHNGNVYDALRVQISSALKGALLVTRNTQLYQEALQARKVAEEANLLKSRFLSTVSHELRTPLSLIIGTIEMLLQTENDSPLLPEIYRHDLDCVRGSAQHLVRLIGDVLDLASSQAGQLRLACVPLNLGAVLRKAAQLGEPMAREKGLNWRAELPPNPPWVWADATRLQQVVLNLIVNAVKFTAAGEIALEVVTGQHEVTVMVSDNGLGIPSAEQEAIFDEFRQSERTATRGFGGMGLGLAISRRLIEMHGGRIGVHSSGVEGGGSTFFFTLPTIDGPPDTEERLANRAESVLLLTENGSGSESLRAHLAQRGFVVETIDVAVRGDWLAEVLADPPGAVLLDFEPAAERGWELMQILKQNSATREMPVLFYALSQAQDSGAVLELDYLSKPVGRAELLRALARQGLSAQAGASPGEPGRAILIVDDESCILDLHARMVEAHLRDCIILRAQNGREALAILAHKHVDLVLLDLAMPEVDGFAVLEAMQSRETLRNIPVIVLTAQILTAHDMARLQQGVCAVMGKGLFSAEEVLSQVEGALARSKRLGSESQRVARGVMAYIHEHFGEPISLDAIAGSLAISKRHLDRCFSQETGVSPVIYLNRYRVKQARALLERGEGTITDVAMAVGFADSSYFGRVFRQEIGLTPAAYRRGRGRQA